MNRFSILGAALAVVLALTGCGAAASSSPSPAAVAESTPATPTPPPAPSTVTGSTTTAAGGAYLDYRNYAAQRSSLADARVVLFFHAPWCPDCRATDTSLATDGVPPGLAVVKVDYDTMSEVKKTFGVTQQHTFVQVDSTGTAVAKWTGSRTGADILARTTG